MAFEETSIGCERMAFDQEGHQEEVRLHFRRNYVAHTLEGGLYMAGLAFISFETILPALVGKLGGPAWMISLSSVLVVVGLSLPSIFVAHPIERLRWKKPLTVLSGVFQRLPFLFAALCLLFLASSHPALTLWVVVFTPFASGLCCGVSFPAWLELVAKTIPGNRMSSLFAARMIIAGVVGFFGGAVIAAVLGRWPGSAGYGILYLITSGFLAASYVVFLFIKETDLPPRHETLGFRESLAEMREILRTDRNFVTYLACRVTVAGAFIAIPFMSLRALDTLRCDECMLGYLVMAMLAGALAGNVFAGVCGDAHGAKTPLIVVTALYVTPFLLAAFATTRIAFLAAFFLLGFCRDGVNVLQGTLNAELPPVARRVRYMSIASALLAPSMLAASAVGTLAWSFSGGFLLPALFASCSLLASAAFLYSVEEPRRNPNLAIRSPK